MDEREYEAHRSVVNRYEVAKSEYNSLVAEKKKIQSDCFGMIVGGCSVTDSHRQFLYRQNLQDVLLKFYDSQIELAKKCMEELRWEA